MTQERARRLYDLYAGQTIAAVKRDDWQGATAYANMALTVTPFGPDVDAPEISHDDNDEEPLEPSPEWLALALAIDGEPSAEDLTYVR